VSGNFQTSTTTLAAGPRYLNNFGIWTPSYIAMHSLWAKKPKGEIAFHKGYWDDIHARGAGTANKWGLPFPFLLTLKLQKKGVKGTLVDGHVEVHLKFGRIQWNQSQSHMPRGLRELAPNAESSGTMSVTHVVQRMNSYVMRCPSSSMR
jgi:hypothetical protein